MLTAPSNVHCFPREVMCINDAPGGLFESKSCDSLLEPDTDVEDGGGVVTLMGHDDSIKTTRDQDPALTDTHGSRNSPDETRSGQTTPSSSSQFPRYNLI